MTENASKQPWKNDSNQVLITRNVLVLTEGCKVLGLTLLVNQVRDDDQSHENAQGKENRFVGVLVEQYSSKQVRFVCKRDSPSYSKAPLQDESKEVGQNHWKSEVLVVSLRVSLVILVIHHQLRHQCNLSQHCAVSNDAKPKCKVDCERIQLLEVLDEEQLVHAELFAFRGHVQKWF